MRLLLYILLLFAFNTDAQITSSVYSGARFGGVVDTGGGTYITLPGCSTQTEIISIDHIRNMNFINGEGSAIEWRNTQFYTDSTLSPFGNSACRTIWLLEAWMVEEPKYLSIFYDLDGDGEYEYLYDNSFLLTTDSFAYQNYQAYTFDLTSLDTMMFRVIFHDVPLSNSCPSSVSGLVIDASYQLDQDCKIPNYADTIIIAGCDDYPIYVPDYAAIPDSISFGGVYTNGYYKKDSLNAIQLYYNDIDDYYYFTLDVSDWPDIDVYETYIYFIFGSNDGIYYEYVSDHWINVDNDGYTVEAYVGSTPYNYYRVGFGLNLNLGWDGECLSIEFYDDAVLTILDAPAELDD